MKLSTIDACAENSIRPNPTSASRRTCSATKFLAVAGWMLAFAAPLARADVIYQNESFVSGTYSGFNNSQGTETEDNWVANSFQVLAGGTRLLSFTFVNGTAATNQAISLIVYRGSSLTNPQAGTGLTRVGTTSTTFTAAANSFATISLALPIDLAVGDIFYAALLIRGVTGSTFPWGSDAGSTGLPAPINRSFFDVGATQGAAYDLDVTTRATVLGGTHPVVGAGVQAPGNLILRVNATAVPEPDSFALACLGLAGLVALVHRRRGQFARILGST